MTFKGNIQQLSEGLSVQAKALAVQAKALDAQMGDILPRFIEFVNTNDLTPPYLDNLEVKGDFPYIHSSEQRENYTLLPGLQSDKGVTYRVEMATGIPVNLLVPYAYIEDREKWEDTIVGYLREDKILLEGIITNYFGPLDKDNFISKIEWFPSPNGRALNGFVHYAKGLKNIKKTGTFVFDLETGDLYTAANRRYLLDANHFFARSNVLTKEEAKEYMSY